MIYIACEELNFIWRPEDVITVDRMWQEGMDIRDIAKAFDRDVDEVAILIMDRVRLGRLGPRKNGVFGRRMPDVYR